jgi:hypothetical protein
MVETGKDARDIIEEENLQQISDEAELRALAVAVLEERPQEVAGYLKGREQLLTFFIGEIMKKTRGRANPQAAGQILQELLEERRAGGGPVETGGGTSLPSTAGSEGAAAQSGEGRAPDPASGGPEGAGAPA